MQLNLVYFKPNGGRKDVPVTKTNSVIGRALDCDVQVPRMGVSRRHCELVAAGEKVTVRDLGSSNGTYVNGERIKEHDLVGGDRLQVGSIVLTLQVDGDPAEIAPPAAPKPQGMGKGKKKPAKAASAGSDEDAIFAQMMMGEEDEDDFDADDSAPPTPVEAISPLDVLTEDDED